MKGTIRVAAGLFVAGAMTLWAFALPPITVDQAHTLVLQQVKEFTDFDAKLDESQDPPQYHVRGTSGSEPFEATIDARAARVVSVTRSGKTVYVWPGVVTVGHRGTLKFAPENTIAAFDKAIALGADLLEMDVRETKDGQLVIMHDQSIARTTTGRGSVVDLTLDEIKQVDAGSKFSADYTGTKVPTFEEVLQAIAGKALPDIDFKAGDPKKVVAAVEEAGLLGRVTLFCGNRNLMKETLAIDKRFIIRPTVAGGVDALQPLLDELNPPIVNIDWSGFSEELVREIHLAGKLAFVNVMGREDNEAGLIRAIESGGDYIQTDRLDLLLPLLRARGLHK